MLRGGGWRWPSWPPWLGLAGTSLTHIHVYVVYWTTDNTWRLRRSYMCCMKQTVVQACTEMVMPMTVSNESMFPPSGFSYEEKSEGCFASYEVRPRMNWITTEYGGHVSFSSSDFQCLHISSSISLGGMCAHQVLHCTTHCRKLTRFSRGLGATSSSPTGCETRGVEAGRSKRFLTVWSIHVDSFNHLGSNFTIVNNSNSFPSELLPGYSRTYHPASLLLSQRKVNMKLQQICKVKRILKLT